MEQPLAGGNAGGAVLVEGTVRRATEPWTPAVHALLRHLADRGMGDASRVLGIDEQGREVLSFLPGATVGDARPWPCWVHSDVALDQVAVDAALSRCRRRLRAGGGRRVAVLAAPRGSRAT